MILNAEVPRNRAGGGELAELQVRAIANSDVAVLAKFVELRLAPPLAARNILKLREKKQRSPAPDQFRDRLDHLWDAHSVGQAFGSATRSWCNDYELLQNRKREFSLCETETRAMKIGAPTASAVPTTDDPTVLVIDDDPLTRGSLSSLFRSVGLNVRTFASAAELLEHPLPAVPAAWS